MKFFKTFSIFLLISFFLVGCSTKKVSYSFLIPPNNTEVYKYKKVAFLPFKGRNGNIFSLKLEAKVKNLYLDGKPIFKIVDRQNIKAILSEQKLNLSGLVDEKDAVKIGKLIGVEAIWTGAVLENNVSIIPYYEKRVKCLDKKCRKFKEYFINCYKKEAKFSFIAKLTDVSSGEVIYSKEHKGFDSGRYCMDSEYTISSNALLENAKEKAINSFLMDIAPHRVNYNLTIKDKIKNISKEDKKLFENSIEWIEKKDINKACKIWKKLFAKYPNNISILYNLGVCYETKNMLNKAYKFYKKAYNLLSKPDEDVLNAVVRVEKLLKQQKKLKKILKEVN